MHGGNFKGSERQRFGLVGGLLDTDVFRCFELPFAAQAASGCSGRRCWIRVLRAVTMAMGMSANFEVQQGMLLQSSDRTRSR